MRPSDYAPAYGAHIRSVVATHPQETDAMMLAVGGDSDAVGALERDLLVQWGLERTDHIIDVGCGSGRLVKALRADFAGQYLGTDVVPELLAYARKLVAGPGWRFDLVNDLNIPADDEAADMVAFFSVFTHLLHEHSFLYLIEAKRVLRHGGRIVFSFLDFEVPDHWFVFHNLVYGLEPAAHLNMFLSRDAIEIWAGHLELRVLAIERGDKPHIPLRHPIEFDNGSVVSTVAPFGQSVCVLEKP